MRLPKPTKHPMFDGALVLSLSVAGALWALAITVTETTRHKLKSVKFPTTPKKWHSAEPVMPEEPRSMSPESPVAGNSDSPSPATDV